MTRDEAFTRVITAPGSSYTPGRFENAGAAKERYYNEINIFIDRLAAIGLLKLDEPKPADYVADLVVEMRAQGHVVSLQSVEGALAAAGLKIVEA